VGLAETYPSISKMKQIVDGTVVED